MDIAIQDQSISITTFALSGRLDALEAGGLREALTASVEAGKNRIIVDLSIVDFVDSAGLAALVKGMKDARAAGGDVKLVMPASADARRVFELTRFDQVFETADSPEGLVNSWVAT